MLAATSRVGSKRWPPGGARVGARGPPPPAWQPANRQFSPLQGTPGRARDRETGRTFRIPA